MSESVLKVIFIGLDNSGKTSILYILEGKFAQIASLKPTIRFTRTDFNILGLPIKIWDLGGQEQYRSEYLGREQYFRGTDVLYYIIDIQDSKRFTESVEYFLSILEVFEKINPEKYPYIQVFLHKYDPYLKGFPEMTEKVSTLKSLFAELSKTVNFTFFETTIYNFEEVSRAFVAGILKVLPKGEVIQEVLRDFMKKTESSAIMLLDENVLLIAEAFKDEQSRNVCRICGPYFANMAERLREYDLFAPDTIEVEMKGQWLFFKHIDHLKTGFYLIFFTKNKENFTRINELLPVFTKDIVNLITYIL